MRAENEIISNWDDSEITPKISICCLTYNHEKYISEAIESFLMQETFFKFEIIIHDDCSTDKTTEIIEYYQKKYPNIIKVIFQTVNQFSLNPHAPLNKVWEVASGDYISICEGDDYFIKSDKILKSFNYMEQNKDVTFLFTPALQQDESQPWNQYSIRNQYKPDDILKINKDWVLKSGGAFYPTPSCIYKKDLINKIPGWFELHCTGDYPIAIIAAHYGRIGYINEVSCCYRKNLYSISNKIIKNKDEAFLLITKKYKTNLLFFEKMFEDGFIEKDMFKYLISKEDYMYYSKMIDLGFLIKSIRGLIKIRFLFRFKFRIVMKVFYALVIKLKI